MDTVSVKRRSEIMSRVRSRGNRSTEGRFCAALSSLRVRGWTKYPNVAGKPDLSFNHEKVAVFLDGCFWHGCPKCKRGLPKSRRHYWKPKIEGNVIRDRVVTNHLRHHGWSVIRFWEHEITESPAGCVKVLTARLVQRRSSAVKPPGRHRQ